MIPHPSKNYLGDGVYIQIENGMFKLTTEDGISETNIIYLELEVANSLKEYILRAENGPQE